MDDQPQSENPMQVQQTADNHEDELECGICHEVIGPGSKVLTIMACDHEFCTECLTFVSDPADAKLEQKLTDTVDGEQEHHHLPTVSADNSCSS